MPIKSYMDRNDHCGYMLVRDHVNYDYPPLMKMLIGTFFVLYLHFPLSCDEII